MKKQKLQPGPIVDNRFGSGQVCLPDREGCCGHCGAVGFSYRNGQEVSEDGVRGYRCMTCKRIKPENWREFFGIVVHAWQ